MLYTLRMLADAACSHVHAAYKTRRVLLSWVMQEGDYQDTIVVPLLSTSADYVGLRIQPGQFAGYSVRQEDAGVFCLAAQGSCLGLGMQRQARASCGVWPPDGGAFDVQSAGWFSSPAATRPLSVLHSPPTHSSPPSPRGCCLQVLHCHLFQVSPGARASLLSLPLPQQACCASRCSSCGCLRVAIAHGAV